MEINNKNLIKINFLTILLLLIFTNDINSSCLGCLELDEITFYKIIKNFEYTLVKFDIAFPYGDKHEKYGDFGRLIGSKLTNLIVALVGVKDYGQNENQKLAKLYNINEKEFPKILLFKNYNPNTWIEYPLNFDINLDNIKLFIKNNTNIYIGLDGCLEVFDKLSQEFMKNINDKMIQQDLIDKGTNLMDTLHDEMDKIKAKIYLKLMKKLLENDGDFNDEEKRVTNLLKSKISENKKQELQFKLNIMKSFPTIKKLGKDEF